MSSAVPGGRGSTGRLLSSFQRTAAMTASTAAVATHGQGPRQNLRVGSHFMAAHSSPPSSDAAPDGVPYSRAVLASNHRARSARTFALAALLVLSAASVRCGP